MPIDIGSPVLDVAIGLAFVFFLLSLVVTAGTEVVSWIVSRRANDLRRGIRGLLRDDAKANAILSHPLVTVDFNFDKNPKPSYITPRAFSLALIDTVAPPGDDEVGSRNALEAMKSRVRQLDAGSPLRRQLLALIDNARGELDTFRGDVEAWFNNAMDRLSGLYRRWAQIVACVIALVVAVSLNADALRIADRLATDETVRASVVAAANQAVATTEEGGTGDSGSAGTPAQGETDPLAAGREAEAVTGQLHALDLPIGWGEANDNVTGSTVAGWFLTFLAISLGGPFWFDTLSRLARLRTTGRKPSRGEGAQQASG